MDPIVCSEDGYIHEGTTIVQRVWIGPIRIESAVRVFRIWQRRDTTLDEVGFSYATLYGHPERGVSTFSVTEHRNMGRITFSIEARSQPGSLVYRIGRPLARRFQQHATKAAMRHMTDPA